jgi:hypothetical protein
MAPGTRRMRATLIFVSRVEIPAMRPFFAAALVGLATVVSPADVFAQVQQRQETIISTDVVPLPPPPVAPRATTGAAATTTIRTYTYEPVCELRREQFADENGWRVRDVRVCR